MTGKGQFFTHQAMWPAWDGTGRSPSVPSAEIKARVAAAVSAGCVP